MKAFLMSGPKGLPKCTKPNVVTVQPDVRLSPKAWALHHRLVNRKVILLP